MDSLPAGGRRPELQAAAGLGQIQGATCGGVCLQHGCVVLASCWVADSAHVRCAVDERRLEPGTDRVGEWGIRVRSLLAHIYTPQDLGLRWASSASAWRGGLAGLGDGGQRNHPHPVKPDGNMFPTICIPVGINLSHLRPLIGKFPVGIRGSGPHCHL